MDGTDILAPIARAAPERLTRDISAPAALALIARECIGRIRANQAGLGAGSPEALHDTRVALRRWRTALSVFRSLLSEEGRRAEADLAWLSDQTNEARDLDVLAPRLQDAPALAEAFEAARQAAYARAGRALRSERAGRLLWRGARAGRTVASVQADGPPPARELAARALDRRRRRLRRRGKGLRSMSASDRHGFRVQAKKTRYAAELLGDLFAHPHRQDRMGRSLRALQDALGELNDIHVGEALVERLSAAAGTSEAGFQAGRLAGRRAAERKALMRRAKKAYERFAGARAFW